MIKLDGLTHNKPLLHKEKNDNFNDVNQDYIVACLSIWPWYKSVVLYLFQSFQFENLQGESCLSGCFKIGPVTPKDSF